jgi:hypothetical protein
MLQFAYAKSQGKEVVDDLILLLNEVTSEKIVLLKNLLPLASSQIAPLILSLYFS